MIRLGDPAIPLFITEGARSANAAASHDLCCIAVLCVWNWRYTNAERGKVVQPACDTIALKGRDVYLVLDSDVIAMPVVRNALDHLAAMRSTRRACVNIVQLPSGPAGNCRSMIWSDLPLALTLATVRKSFMLEC